MKSCIKWQEEGHGQSSLQTPQEGQLRRELGLAGGACPPLCSMRRRRHRWAWTPPPSNPVVPCCRAVPLGCRRRTYRSEEDYLKRRKEVKSILKKNSDWIWNWSSWPESIPCKEFFFKHLKHTATLNMRSMSVLKKGGTFSAGFLKVFLLSLLLSHLLAIGLGIYIGRHLTASHQHLLMKNWI